MLFNILEFDISAIDNKLVVRLPTTEPRFSGVLIECCLGGDN